MSVSERGEETPTMLLQPVQSAIATIVAPVVMVTACAILVGGMLTQYNQINERLRTFARERLDLLRSEEGGLARVADLAGAYTRERLRELDTQLPLLLKRYQRIRNAVLAMYCAVLLFVATMLTIGLAYGLQSAGWATGALVLFLVGMGITLVGLAQHAVFVVGGNTLVRYETQRILDLGR
jgi:hypothetical protein